MKAVTNLMVYDYNIKKTGCDFMGYKVERYMTHKDCKNPIQFHHLIVPKRDCQNIEDNGYVKWNGALLVNDSHEYLHRIEQYERKMFDYITELMIFENQQGYLDKKHLLEIRDILEEFELIHSHDRTKKGKQLIKRDYLYNRLSREEIEENKFLKKF